MVWMHQHTLVIKIDLPGLLVEKAGMVVQLQDWFGDFGFPILALGGYSSQTFVKTLGQAIEREVKRLSGRQDETQE